MHELGIATSADAVVAPIILAGAAVGTAVEQRATMLTSGEEHPTGANLLVGEPGALVGVAICIVALYPGYEVVGGH